MKDNNLNISNKTLATLLNEIRVEVSFFVKSEYENKWAFKNQALDEAIFHFVVEGELEIKSINGEIYKFHQGDLVLAPHGEEHLLFGDNEKTVLICGAMKLNPSWHPLFKSLPSFIYLKREEQICSLWLDSIMELINSEDKNQYPGNEAIVSRLNEILVIESIRKWLMNSKESTWSLALDDKDIADALFHIHQSPQNSWTVESLSRKVSLSRASFANKFAQKVGKTPIEYLTFLRMNLAADNLKKGLQTIEEVAVSVGYDSVVSFSRAFKKFWGKAPGRYKLEIN